VLASAVHYDLSAVLDQQPVRVCGIAEIFPQSPPAAGGPARGSWMGCSSEGVTSRVAQPRSLAGDTRTLGSALLPTSLQVLHPIEGEVRPELRARLRAREADGVSSNSTAIAPAR
jgi:hypothetical protein